MKLKRVAALCRRSMVFRLYDRVDAEGVATQWLGDGGAIYPLNGLPFLDKDGLYRIFDVPEKTQKKISFASGAIPEGLNVDDYAAGETIAEDMGVTLSYGGKVLLPLRAAGGILYIQSRYLEPLEDQADFLQLYVRRTGDGGRYIAAKVGMLLRGVIMPCNVNMNGLVNRLDEIAQMTRWEAEQQEAARANRLLGQDQENLFKNGGSGGSDED